MTNTKGSMVEKFLHTELAQGICVCITIIYFHLAGIIDGLIWGRRGADSLKGDEHNYLVASRGAVFLIAILPMSWILAILTVFLFPMIHNGAYYLTRNRISGGVVYAKGWGSKPSKGSTASINFSFKLRMILGLIGIAGIIVFFNLN